MNRLLIFAALFFAFTGCKENSDAFKLTHNGDQRYGWINMNTLRPESEGSTNSVSYIDSVSQYSLGYRQKLGELTGNQIEEITFQADVKPLGDNSNFSYVISVEQNGKSILWEGKKVGTKDYAANKWHSITHSAKVSKDLYNKDYELCVYVWNNAGAAMVDNVIVKGK